MDLNNVALGVVIGWIVIIIILFIFMLIKYTFKEWPEDKPNPYAKETLGMPRGAFRGILTLSILFIVMVLEINSLKFSPEELDVAGKIFIPEDRFREMMVAFQMVVAFYFGSKVMHHVTSAQRDTAKNRAGAAVEEAKARVGVIDKEEGVQG